MTDIDNTVGYTAIFPITFRKEDVPVPAGVSTEMVATTDKGLQVIYVAVDEKAAQRLERALQGHPNVTFWKRLES